MRDKDRLIELMIFENGLNLVAHLVFSQCRMCYAKADGHDLNSNDPHSVIGAAPTVQTGIELDKKVDIGVETDSNTMNKDHRSSGKGRMRTMPVGESFGRRAPGVEKDERSQGENDQEVAECSSAKGETVIM